MALSSFCMGWKQSRSRPRQSTKNMGALRQTQKVRISAGETPRCRQSPVQMASKSCRMSSRESFRSSASCRGTQSMSGRSSKALARIWSPAKSW